MHNQVENEGTGTKEQGFEEAEGAGFRFGKELGNPQARLAPIGWIYFFEGIDLTTHIDSLILPRL